MTMTALGRLLAPVGKIAVAGLLAGFGLAGAASAATVNCPGTAITTDREFLLTTTVASSCFASGSGNLSGNPSGAKPDPLYALLAGSFGPGHVLIDKSDDKTSGISDGSLSGATSGTSGSFSFALPSAPDGQLWTNVVLASCRKA